MVVLAAAAALLLTVCVLNTAGQPLARAQAAWAARSFESYRASIAHEYQLDDFVISHHRAPHSVVDALTSLVHKSLVRQEEDGRGEPRFSLLETMREYAQERLQESGEVTVVRRHASFYLSLAEAAGAALSGPEHSAALDRLEQEHDNLRAALGGDDARAAASLTESLTLANSVGSFLQVALGLVCLAGGDTARELPLPVARLFGAAEALLERLGILMTSAERAEWERNVKALYGHLEPEAFLAAWEEGQTTAFEHAVAQALLPSAMSA